MADLAEFPTVRARGTSIRLRFDEIRAIFHLRPNLLYRITRAAYLIAHAVSHTSTPGHTPSRTYLSSSPEISFLRSFRSIARLMKSVGSWRTHMGSHDTFPSSDRSCAI